MIKHRKAMSAGFAAVLAADISATAYAAQDTSSFALNTSATTIQASVVPISTTGSLQNPCFSPDGSKIVFTRFRKGYNTGLSDIMLVGVAGGTPVTLSTVRAQNVNLPGSCWDATTNQIVFTADPDDGDQIFVVPATGGTVRQVSNFTDKVAWEPSFSPDGQWIAFEAHLATNPDGTPGTIWKIKADGTSPTPLTFDGNDNREPNWSPRGDLIVFQSLRSGSPWKLYTIAPDGSGVNQVTTQLGEQTDASFTPDGRYVIYSSDADALDQAGLWAAPSGGGLSSPIRIGAGRMSYDGAPSVSRDGQWIVFETFNGSPDGSSGTKIEILPMPVLP